MREHAEASAYVQLIVNEGHEAGASLEHSHAQLYALGFVPAAIARERERFVSYNQHTMGGDLLAEIASEEVRRRERLVAIDDETLLICPWASRSPFELRLIPSPAPSFELDGEVGVGAPDRSAGPGGPVRRDARAQPVDDHRPRGRISSTGTSTSRPGSGSGPGSRCRPASS